VEKLPLKPARRIGRYLICGELAAGGMATVHIGRLIGPVGFARTVAIKRLHPQFAKDPEFVSMFLDEARLAARIRHPNVVPVLDVVAADGELFLVMDFVIGESISRMCRLGEIARDGVPVRVALSLMCGVLQGLHAAHETRGEKGEPLGIVHRDISPQNILLGNDGAARLIDFGIAKAMGRVHTSQSGQLKGKLPYMAPEHVRGEATRQSDVFASGVVLWELIAGKRLFAAETEVETFTNVLQAVIPRPSEVRNPSMRGGVDLAILRSLDDVIMKALQRDATLRYRTAREFAGALEKVVSPASTLDVCEWMEQAAGDRGGRNDHRRTGHDDGFPIATDSDAGAWVWRLARRTRNRQ
jgi:eukaryotic-like serine/threonine-protein kinase